MDWGGCLVSYVRPGLTISALFTRLSKDAEINEKSTKKLQDQTEKTRVCYLWRSFLVALPFILLPSKGRSFPIPDSRFLFCAGMERHPSLQVIIRSSFPHVRARRKNFLEGD